MDFAIVRLSVGQIQQDIHGLEGQPVQGSLPGSSAAWINRPTDSMNSFHPGIDRQVAHTHRFLNLAFILMQAS